MYKDESRKHFAVPPNTTYYHTRSWSRRNTRQGLLGISALQLGSDFRFTFSCLGLAPPPIRFPFKSTYSLRHSLFLI